jgi:hypothetical protein
MNDHQNLEFETITPESEHEMYQQFLIISGI